MTTQPPASFQVSLVAESEIPALVSLIVPTFAHYEVERIFGNTTDPEALTAAGQRHRLAWQQHKDETGLPSGVKCTTRDPETGEDVMAACAYWFIFPSSRSAEEMAETNYLISGEWLAPQDGERERAQRIMQPTVDVRRKWLSNRPHAILMYMATDPAWRRRGAATAVVQWGLERCRELKIPAFLEASEDGKKVYQKLGFEVVDEVVMEMGGETARFPAMMWWPPGTEEEAKQPLTGR